MLQQEQPDDYVISTGKCYSVREFLNTVFEIAELNVTKHVVIDPRLYRPHEVPYLLGNSSKANKVLNWYPKTNLKDLANLMYKEDINKYHDFSNRI
jgi:GDPmannose 4,6-dehydratase